MLLKWLVNILVLVSRLFIIKYQFINGDWKYVCYKCADRNLTAGRLTSQLYGKCLTRCVGRRPTGIAGLSDKLSGRAGGRRARRDWVPRPAPTTLYMGLTPACPFSRLTSYRCARVVGFSENYTDRYSVAHIHAVASHSRSHISTLVSSTGEFNL